MVMSISRNVNNPSDDGTGFLSHVTLYILPSGISRSRQKLFQTQAIKNGATVRHTLTDDTTHMIVDENISFHSIQKIMKWDSPPSRIKIVKSLWLSNCLKHGQQLDSKELEVQAPETYNTQLEIKKENYDGKSAGRDSGIGLHLNEHTPEKAKRRKTSSYPQNKSISNSDSEYVTSDEDSGGLIKTPLSSPDKTVVNTESFICSSPSSKAQVNYNKHITDKLQILSDTYKNTKDQWRAFGYQKAIMTLKAHPKEITTWEEARTLPGIGERLADKIWEIIQSGHLRKIDEVCSGERMTAITLFTNIWGAGPSTAESWVQQGFRTLDDLRTKARLTKHQQIGLKHYQDLLERMPRDEASEIVDTVKDAALSINPGLEIVACGSYRRGQSNCGDVDILITHSNGKSHVGILPTLVDYLHKTNFLTDDLVSQEENGNQKKYMGVCKLPGENKKHRRLDIIVIPYSEFACAQLYFTGSAHFNRSMRLLAKKMGMALSEHSLNDGVIRNNQQVINSGYPLPTPTEESVFHHLGLVYRPPEERDH